jgi:hypothetical protein
MTELERELRGLAAAIAFPETPDIVAGVQLVPPPGRSARRSWRVGALVTAVVLAAAVATALAVPQARTSILNWLRIGDVEIRFVDRLPEVRPSAPLALGNEIDPADASFPLLRPAVLGTPDAVYRSGDVVTLLYGSPERVRALITEIPNSGFSPSVGKKLAGSGTHVEFVPIRGSDGPALWISGEPHVVDLPGGPARLAASTLIWTSGRLTIRLEGAETLQQARVIAESVG